MAAIRAEAAPPASPQADSSPGASKPRSAAIDARACRTRACCAIVPRRSVMRKRPVSGDDDDNDDDDDDAAATSNKNDSSGRSSNRHRCSGGGHRSSANLDSRYRVLHGVASRRDGRLEQQRLARVLDAVMRRSRLAYIIVVDGQQLRRLTRRQRGVTHAKSAARPSRAASSAAAPAEPVRPRSARARRRAVDAALSRPSRRAHSCRTPSLLQ